jgi:hypothetical protein
VFTVDVDWGCTVIRRRSEGESRESFSAPSELSYGEFDGRRAEWLRLISVADFRARLLR